MKHYELQQNETILYRGNVEVSVDGAKTSKEAKFNTELILTNLNFVFLTQKKKLFGHNTTKEVFDVNEVKFYDDSAQIIRKKSYVDIYMLNGEKFITFPKEKEAKLFCDKALKLVSGYSKFVRGVKKTQKAINETNAALDINIGEAVSTVAAVTSEAVITLSDQENASPKMKFAGAFVTALQKHKKTSNSTKHLLSEEETKDTEKSSHETIEETQTK